MNFFNPKALLFAGATLSLVTATSPLVRAETPTIKIDGSSTVFPITEAVAEEFQKSKSNQVHVTVGISGTGGGFKKFCRAETDLQDASRPILKEEIGVCKAASIEYFEFPVGYDAITLVVSTKNTWLKEIQVDDLKKIWEPAAQGKITRWNQVRKEWPDAPIKLYGAGSDSGTFDYFTEAVVGKAKSSRGDYTASEDDNTLVQGVSTDPNALGYIPYSYFAENPKKLHAVAVIGGEKSPMKNKAVLPSNDSIVNGSYYPLARPIFIYANKKSTERPEVKEFIEFYMKNGASLVKQVKYVPLPAKAYSLNSERFKKNKTGTLFGGENQIGVRIEELLKKEAK